MKKNLYISAMLLASLATHSNLEASLVKKLDEAIALIDSYPDQDKNTDDRTMSSKEAASSLATYKQNDDLIDYTNDVSGDIMNMKKSIKQKNMLSLGGGIGTENSTNKDIIDIFQRGLNLWARIQVGKDKNNIPLRWQYNLWSLDLQQGLYDWVYTGRIMGHINYTSSTLNYNKHQKIEKMDVIAYDLGVIQSSFAEGYKNFIRLSTRKSKKEVDHLSLWIDKKNKIIKQEDDTIKENLRKVSESFIAYLKKHEQDYIQSFGKKDTLFLFPKQDLETMFKPVITFKKRGRPNGVIASRVKSEFYTSWKKPYKEFFEQYLLSQFEEHDIAGLKYLALKK